MHTAFKTRLYYETKHTFTQYCITSRTHEIYLHSFEKKIDNSNSQFCTAQKKYKMYRKSI